MASISTSKSPPSPSTSPTRSTRLHRLAPH
jgi:hypothetical protein